MYWILWLLVIPVLGACWFLFALCRAAAKADPKPSPMSARELDGGEELSMGNPAMRRRAVAGPWHHGLFAQAGYVRFAAEARKRRSRRH